jgi:hypothetical protein
MYNIRIAFDFNNNSKFESVQVCAIDLENLLAQIVGS